MRSKRIADAVLDLIGGTPIRSSTESAIRLDLMAPF